MRERVNWNFIIGTTLLIVNLIVALADWLQGGYTWPVPLLACLLQVLVLATVRG